MLFKLLKYDFRAMWKQFSLVWGAALILALVNRFTMGGGAPLAAEQLSALMALTFGAVLVAMFVLAIIFVVQRFSKGLLGDEGYLMHTLPVRPWQLVLSKLICGTVTWMGCGVVALLSPVLMVPFHLPDLLQFPWLDALRGLMKHPDVLALMAEFCLVILSFIVLLIAVMYLSMAVGHLLINAYSRVFSYGFVQSLLDMTTANAYGAMLTASATMLIPAALFLAAVCWILEHKLNLE